MDLDSLHLFVDVMRLGSFAKAARRRDVDPSSISRAIAALESELGFRLFQRTTRKLSPTEAGLRYLQRIEAPLGELSGAGAELRDLSAAPAGMLRITASVAFGVQCLAPVLPELRTAYPDLEIDLVLTDANLDLVAERIDVAIRLGPRLSGDMIAMKLFETNYRVVASPDYIAAHGRPGSPEFLAEHDCLLFPFNGFRSTWCFEDAAGGERRVEVNGKMTVSNALALRQCTLAGLGPALLANWTIDRDVTAGRLVNLFPDYRIYATERETAAWILYPSRDFVPRKVRVFIDFLKDRLGRQPVTVSSRPRAE